MDEAEADACRLLDEVQHDIDGERRRFAERDFECKLEHHVRIKPLLCRRDAAAASLGAYWARVLGNYGPGAALLPRGEGGVATGWMRALSAGTSGLRMARG